MRVVSKQDSAISMDSSVDGDALKLDYLDGFAVSVLVTRASGTLAGTFKLQGTASDPFTNNVTSTPNPSAIWDDIPGSDQAVSTTTTATYSYNASGIHYRGVRLIWTSSTGTGAYTADWHAKGTNA